MSATLIEGIASDANALGVPLEDGVAERLAALLERVQRFSKRVNLIAKASLHENVTRHITDSLALLRLVAHPSLPRLETWWDIGTGGGFPGLVWAVARPELTLRLVEPITKKAALLNRLAREFASDRVEVISARLGDLEAPEDPVGLVSRAVFAPEVWLERAGNFGVPGSVILLTSGRAQPPEVLTRASVVDQVTLPRSDVARVNVAVTL